MIAVSAIPFRVLFDLKERGHSEDEIRRMTPKQAFKEYCEWNGLVCWGDDLWNVVHALQNAEMK